MSKKERKKEMGKGLISPSLELHVGANYSFLAILAEENGLRRESGTTPNPTLLS